MRPVSSPPCLGFSDHRERMSLGWQHLASVQPVSGEISLSLLPYPLQGGLHEGGFLGETLKLPFSAQGAFTP